MTIKSGDFVQLSYTGKLHETGDVFDTTDKAVAEKENILQKNKEYGPSIICVGEGQIMPGLDESVVGKEEAETYNITIPPEKAFGKKDAKRIKLIQMRKFKEQNVNPVPGMSVFIDDDMGFIKSVSSGRVLVDFNHPFSGRTVDYTITVDKILTDAKEKINAVLKLGKFSDAETKVDGKKAHITFKNPIPEQMTKVIETHVKHLVKDVEEVTFTTPEDFEASQKK